jgi:hypothetical protein
MLQRIRWTANLAYVIGLITTDGCLSKDGRHIVLVSKDIDQLVNFAKILKLGSKICNHTGSYNSKGKYFHITCSSVKFYKFLISIGLTPNKTKTLGPVNIPDRYFIDFLRGHLDGDGTILTYIDKYNIYKGVRYANLRIYIFFISVSYNHISWLYRNIKINLAITGTLIQKIDYRKGHHLKMWVIKFSKKESVKLIHLLYYKPGLPTLERKRKIAMQILEMVSKEKRKIYTKINSGLKNL